MSFRSETYRVFIASPSDLTEERQVATDTINEWNSRNAKAKSIVLLPVKGETHALPQVNIRPEEAVIDQLITCDVLVGLFWTRLGTGTGVSESGTVEEIDHFVAAGKPAMLYFSDRAIPPSRIDRGQQAKLKRFRAKINKTAFVREFSDIDQLRTLLNQDLTEQVQKLVAGGENLNKAAPQLNSTTRVFESIEVYKVAMQAVLRAQKRVLNIVDWLVPYVPSDKTKARASYYEALWNKAKNSGIEYKRIIQVPKVGADPLRRNPQFVAHLRQCIEERDNPSKPAENIGVFLCEDGQQRVSFTIVDQNIIFLELSQLQLSDGIECAKSTEFLMIEDITGNVIHEFEKTFQLLIRRCRRMEMEDIRKFAGYDSPPW